MDLQTNSSILTDLFWLPIGAVLGWLVDRAAAKLLASRKRRQLAFVFPISESDHEIPVRCSVIKKIDGQYPSTFRAYVHSAEAIAMQNISREFARCGLHLGIGGFYAEGASEDHRNLILLGSDERFNPYCGELLQDLGTDIRHVPGNGSHKHFEYRKNSGDPWQELRCDPCQAGEDGTKFTKDYGLIIRKRLTADSNVLMCAGIHMHGTLAAVQVALDSAFQDEVKKCGFAFFVQVIKVAVRKDGLSLANDGVSWKDYDLKELRPRR